MSVLVGLLVFLLSAVLCTSACYWVVNEYIDHSTIVKMEKDSAYQELVVSKYYYYSLTRRLPWIIALLRWNETPLSPPPIQLPFSRNPKTHISSTFLFRLFTLPLVHPNHINVSSDLRTEARTRRRTWWRCIV